MIYLLIIYLLFQIGYDQWGGDSVISSVIYFAFQWGWIASIGIYHFLKTKKPVYLILALIFFGLMINEILCFNLTTGEYMETVSGESPAFALTGITLLLFLLYEIINKWKNK